MTESRVDWTGRRFLLDLEAGVEPDAVAREAERVLGEGASVLGEEQTRSALEAYRSGETWMRAGETLRLSRHEASVLGRQYGDEAAAAIGLDDAARGRLAEVFERELTAAFERSHAATGAGSGSVEGELQVAGQQILQAGEEFLDAGQRAALETWLQQRFGRPSQR